MLAQGHIHARAGLRGGQIVQLKESNGQPSDGDVGIIYPLNRMLVGAAGKAIAARGVLDRAGDVDGLARDLGPAFGAIGMGQRPPVTFRVEPVT